MLYGQIKPRLVKITRSRFRYKWWGLLLNKPLVVIGWDMKYLLVADERVVGVYRVLWKDVHLVESEQIFQVPIIKTTTSKIVNRPKEKTPFFKAGIKTK